MRKKRISNLRKLIKIALPVILVLILITQSSYLQKPTVILADSIGAICAAAVIPEAAIDSEIEQASEISAEANTTVAVTSEQSTTMATTPTTTSSQAGEVMTYEACTVPITAVAASNAAGKIITQTVGRSGATDNYNGVYIRNATGVEVSIKDQLSIEPDCDIELNAAPQVLIVHTHATECYYPSDSATYSDDWPTRTTDKTKNVVAVGKVLKDKLNEAGIITIQSETLHDKDAYTGSYDRSRETIKEYLEKYPSIQIVLDIHRDSITYDDNSKLKPTVTVNGKKAAQIMIISGCEAGPVTDFPDWIENLRFGLRLQQSFETTYPLLARPLFFAQKLYNQDLKHCSLLIEMGSEANTLEEAKYSAELLAEMLVKTFS